MPDSDAECPLLDMRMLSCFWADILMACLFSIYSRMELSFQDWIENIIDDLTQNGVMDPGRLYEPPSTDSHPEGLDGVFRDDDADQIISLVRSFNETVESQFGARED